MSIFAVAPPALATAVLKAHGGPAGRAGVAIDGSHRHEEGHAGLGVADAGTPEARSSLMCRARLCGGAAQVPARPAKSGILRHIIIRWSSAAAERRRLVARRDGQRLPLCRVLCASSRHPRRHSDVSWRPVRARARLGSSKVHTGLEDLHGQGVTPISIKT